MVFMPGSICASMHAVHTLRVWHVLHVGSQKVHVLLFSIVLSLVPKQLCRLLLTACKL